MGWTSYNATYYKNGKIDRKAECDAYFMEGLNKGHFKVLKSAMVGSVYYAAVTNLKRCVKENGEYVMSNGEYVREDVPEEEREVWAAIFLTKTDMKDYYNFYYKDMSEDMLPGYYDCPKGILDLLSPTENENALEWRKKCREQLEKKKNGNSISKLPIGTKVVWTRWDGTEMTLIKREPYAQFKTWWWQIEGERKYIQKKLVTEENIKIVA